MLKQIGLMLGKHKRRRSAMNSDSPGESEIISTRGPQLFGTFFA